MRKVGTYARLKALTRKKKKKTFKIWPGWGWFPLSGLPDQLYRQQCPAMMETKQRPPVVRSASQKSQAALRRAPFDFFTFTWLCTVKVESRVEVLMRGA